MTLKQQISGHRRSKVIVPSRSPLVLSYMTSIVSNMVSLTAFEIFDVEFLRPRSRTVQGHSRSKMTVPIDSTWVTSYSTSINPIVGLVTVFETLHV